jgi:hypothetical protein
LRRRQARVATAQMESRIIVFPFDAIRVDVMLRAV